jgi:NADH-quinone oxidoreductase subunit L
METLAIVAVFAPLLGAAAAGLFGKQLEDAGAEFLTCALMVIAAGASLALASHVFGGEATQVAELFTWISSGSLKVSWALKIDQLSAVMMVVINVVSAAVHIYSVGYMHDDDHRARFMSYLSLFTFAMLALVTAANFVQLFFGWEGVGLASYLLIGFWNKRDSANAAAVKAFVMNRIGDFGLGLGIFAVFLVFGTLDYDKVFAMAEVKKGLQIEFLGHSFLALNLICLLLFIGAMGKSAQLGLHTWLPDAMEGPTPVSALIHAATMVTAGVFLVARMSPLYEYAPDIRAFITVVGAATAFVAATIGVTQFDIKRVIAYSTMSQLGYMFFALGVSAYGAAMFHLFTHAFFKALLFLGAGSVIHAMSAEQDMRHMGGIKHLIPVTYVLMWIGSLALAGIFPFAGYFSKDTILEAAWAAHSTVGTWAYWAGIIAAFLTAFYSCRLLFLTFHGTPHANEKVMAHVHESPWIMLAPLFLLAAGAIGAGFIFKGMFVGEHHAEFWGKAIFLLPGNDTLEKLETVPASLQWLPTIVAVAGGFTAWLFYISQRHWPAMARAMLSAVHDFVYNKWYFDELYERIAVIPAFFIGRTLWKVGDGTIIDGCGPDGIAAAVDSASVRTRGLQTGYVYHYAFAMLIGVVGLVGGYIYFTQAGGGR